MEEIKGVYKTTEFKAVLDYNWRLHILDLWGINKKGRTVTNAVPELIDYLVKDRDDLKKITGVSLYGTDCIISDYKDGVFSKIWVGIGVLPDGREIRPVNPWVHYPFYDEMNNLYRRTANGLY